ncbi:hypothetical protein GBA52_010597 [Prunus armeniaca]|nr:hypothetical protein GBA52_010597 [Prunus armeniaca]
MTKSIGEGNESLNKPGSKGSGPVHVFTTKGFRKNSVLLTQEYVKQVPNIGTIGTVEVPVELAGNVINEEGNEEENCEQENCEEESTESDTDIDGGRRRLEFEDSADESDKSIYETDNDAALDDNNEIDIRKSSSHSSASVNPSAFAYVNLSASASVNLSAFASVNPSASMHPTPRQGPRLLGVSSSAPWKPPGKAPRK